MNRLKLLFLTLIFVVLTSNSTFACSCIGPDSPKEALKIWSDAVFSGEIIAVNGEDFTFKVERVWKGVSDKEIVVLDSFVGSSCDSGLKIGGRYIIFASFLKDKDKTTSVNEQGKPIFHIDTCSWSASLANPNTNKKIIKKLGKGKSIN